MATSMTLDVVQEPDRLIVRAEMGGMRPDEVKVTIEDDVLTISGEHDETVEDRGDGYARRERHYGAFARSIGLPEGARPQDAAATYREGRLEVTVPIAEDEEAKPATGRIEVTPTVE